MDKTKKGAEDIPNSKPNGKSLRGTLISSSIIGNHISNKPDEEIEQILTRMHELFEARITFLRKHLYKAVKSVRHDDVIEIMQNDPTTRDFVSSRLNEIIQVIYLHFSVGFTRN